MDGIFLHTSWRSSGTWIWQRLRAEAGHMGFYEPLHEGLASMRPAELRQLSPGSWQSGHGAVLSPYFAEYETLLQPGPEGGISLAAQRFAFDRVFLSAAEPDAELFAYISQLCALARDSGQIPVFKFARSQGRLPWFRAHFPQAQHVTLIRQPWTQFRSAWRCYAADGNKYFLATAFLVLERNLAHPGVAALARAFGLKLGWGSQLPLRARLKAWKLAVRLLDEATLYKAHFALWLLNTLQACAAADKTLDGDAPPAVLAGAFGLQAGQARRPVFQAPPRWPALTPDSLQHIHDKALRVLAPQISPAMLPRLQAWLCAAETTASRDLAGGVALQFANRSTA